MIALLMLLLAAAPSGAASPPADAAGLARSFAAALSADDQAALDAIAVGDKAAPDSWRSAIGLITRYQDIRLTSRLRASRLEGDSLRLEVEVAGTGVTSGGKRETEPLPGLWHLTADREGDTWRIAAAVSAERRLAEELASATPAAIEAAVAGRAAADFDLRRFTKELGDTASEVDDGAAALEWAITTSRQRSDSEALSDALRMRSYVGVRTHRFAEAERDAREALAVATGAGDPDAISASLFSLGVAHWMSGDVPSAVETWRRATERLDSLRDPSTALRALYMAGLLETNFGRVRSALEIASELEGHQRRYPSARRTLDLSNLLALIHSELGNVQLARREYEAALAAAEQLGERQRIAIALGNLATWTENARDLERASALLDRMVAMAPDLTPGNRVIVFADLAERQARRGELAAAERSFGQALEVARSMDEPAVVGSVLARQSALRLRQGRPQEALTLAREAVTHASQAPRLVYLPLSPWVAYTNMGRALLALDQPGEAESAFRAAIDEIETAPTLPSGDPLSPVAPTETRAVPYRLLVDLLASRQRPLEALVVADHLRARSLRDQLERGRVDLSASLSAEERQREQDLEERLGDLNRSLFATADDTERTRLSGERTEARLAIERFRTEAYAAHSELRQRRAQVPVDAAAAWARSLPVDGLVLELLVAPDHVVAFLVGRRPDGNLSVETRRLAVGETALAPAVAAFNAALASGDPAFAAPARALYDALIAPFADRLAGVRTLCIIPDGILWQVPFQVLRDAEGRALLERLAVFRSPSLTALSLATDRMRSDQLPTLIAFGNPTIAGATTSQVRALERGPDLGALPDAEREVHTLGRLYGAGRSRVRVGTAARERSLKEQAPGYDVIHLATHGLVDDQAPLFSALLLAAAPGDGEDGLLEVREIAELALQARLVVLSACESGRGRIHPGEGVIGMSWAFLAAGVPTLVVSDWNAPSAATASLMIDLHRQLLRGVHPAEALRQAQLARRRDPRHAHPHFWAGFTVVGDGW